MDERALERASSYIKGWLKFNYERDDIPGFVVAIAHNGKIIFNEAYGYANLEKKEKLTPQHLFRIASHSKTFTATAVMQLQEQGKLRIDDYAANYLPWLKKHKDVRWHKVTVRQLLSHGAGVIRDGLKSGYWELSYPFPDEGEFRNEILSADLVIDNNTKLKYSNFGYTLLGMIVTEISGMPYNQYVTENIVKPLSLINTGPEFSKTIESKLVTGYSKMGPHKKRLPVANIDTHAMSPATGFYSNSEDLCKYFSAHLLGTGKLLSDESKKEMRRVQWQAENTREKSEYGLGIEIEYVNKHRLLGHGGGFPGHITNSFFDPDNQLVVIVLTNANGSRVVRIAKGVIKVLDYFQKGKKPAKWEKYEGRYMNLWSNRDVVAVGEKLVLTTADSWEPFEEAEELEHVKDDTFRIAKADSFSSFGENVEFKLGTNEKVKAMFYAGGIMLPEAKYMHLMATKNQIEQGMLN